MTERIREYRGEAKYTHYRCPKCGDIQPREKSNGWCQNRECDYDGGLQILLKKEPSPDPTPDFIAGFWAGRGDHRNVLEAWHAHTGKEPPTLEQLKEHYAK